MGLRLENEVARRVASKHHPKIISNNPVYILETAYIERVPFMVSIIIAAATE